MSAETETKIATFLAVALGAVVYPLAQAGQGLLAGICGALATGIAAAYHIPRPADRKP